MKEFYYVVVESNDGRADFVTSFDKRTNDFRCDKEDKPLIFSKRKAFDVSCAIIYNHFLLSYIYSSTIVLPKSARPFLCMEY